MVCYGILVVWYGMARYGMVPGMVYTVVRYGTARHGMVRHRTIWCGTARYIRCGTALYGTVRHGVVCVVWYCAARCGMIWYWYDTVCGTWDGMSARRDKIQERAATTIITAAVVSCKHDTYIHDAPINHLTKYRDGPSVLLRTAGYQAGIIHPILHCSSEHEIFTTTRPSS